MLSINNEFMTKYIALEKICNDIFECINGVTEYINQMEERSDCKIPNSVWYTFWNKLRRCRDARNHMVHSDDFVFITKNDIDFLDKLYKDILGRRDPLCKLPALHTATFYFDNETCQKVRFKEGIRRINEPPVPPKDGYVGKWENYTLGKEDITVKAVYTPKMHKVSFYADNRLIETVSFKEGDRYISEPTVPSKIGYDGKWEKYILANENIEVHAIYKLVDISGSLHIIITNEQVNYDWTSDITSASGGPVGANRKNGFVTYDTKGNAIGIVYMCDDHRSVAYGASEIMFLKKYQKSFGRWHIIKIQGQYLPYTDLVSILSTCSEYNVITNRGRGRRQMGRF